MDSTEIEKLFHKEAREKKRIGSNVNKRALRRGGIRGGMKTPYDFLTTKQRKELNGEVRVTNMYDKYKDISNCDIKELRNLPKDSERVAIFKFIKENHSVESLMEKWDFTKGNISNVFSREIPKVINKFRYDEIKAIGVYAIENDNVLSFGAYKLKRETDKTVLMKRYLEKYPMLTVGLLMGVSKGTLLVEVKKRAIDYKMNVENAKNMVDVIQKKYDDEKIDDILIKNKIDIERFDPTKYKERHNEVMRRSRERAKAKAIEKAEVETEIKVTEEEQMNMSIENKELEQLKESYNNLLEEVKEFKRTIAELREKAVEEKEGISFNLKGNYSKEEVEKRLVSTSYILQDNYIYNIDLKITEVEKIEEEEEKVYPKFNF